jgi:uncharacterized protein
VGRFFSFQVPRTRGFFSTLLKHAPDNVVLEAALIGKCAVLVTGDKEHLLPLNPFQGLAIEPPSVFLKRLA